jgi:hypothetical protein
MKPVWLSRLFVVSSLAAAVTAPAAPLYAQDPGGGPVLRKVVRQLRAIGPGLGDESIGISMMGDALAGKAMKGAPFTATAVSEFEQPLADGNRIRQKSSAGLARDSAGRTRRELQPGAVGPLLAPGEPQRFVHIHDPIGGTNITLDETRKKAFRLKRGTGPGAGPGEPGAPFELSLPPPPPGPPAAGERGRIVEDDVVVIAHRGGGLGAAALPLVDGLPADAPKPVREDLGSQTMEGVKVDGTRATVTIPAGKLGNERPLVVVTERWFSPELGVVVMSRHSDPRLGTTSYRLTGIQRREPPAALFEVPAGYALEEGPMMLRRRVVRPAP